MKINISSGNIKKYEETVCIKEECQEQGIMQSLKKVVNEIIDEELKNNSNQILNYTSPKGDKSLREIIANLMTKKHGKLIRKENIIITNGTQEAINIIATMLRISQKKIIVEEPTYDGSIDTFKINHILDKGLEIDIDNENLLINQLNKTDNGKFLYCIPNCNNPLGITYKNKEEIVQKCKDLNITIVEDDPYSELDFNCKECKNSKNMQSLLSLSDNVIYLGTYSKLISPSIKIGFIITFNDEYLNKMYEIKKIFSLSTSTFVQKIIYRFLKENISNDMIEMKVSNYKHTYDILKEYIEKYHKENIIISQIKGGMFTSLTFKNKYDISKKINSYDDNSEDKYEIENISKNYINKEKGKNILRVNLSNDYKEIVNVINFIIKTSI